MSGYSRMLKIEWEDRITNEEVLDRSSERRALRKNLPKRRVDRAYL